jgi:hypothetical protein
MEIVILYGPTVYVVMQVFMLMRPCSRTCRVAASVPIVLVVPTVVLAVIQQTQGHYHALLPVFGIAPLALLYLAFVWMISVLSRVVGGTGKRS